MLYVLETDAPCLQCGDEHGYVTTMCNLCVWIDWQSAVYVGRHIEGSAVRPIEEVPEGISYTLYLHEKGRPAENAPKTSSTLSRS